MWKKIDFCILQYNNLLIIGNAWIRNVKNNIENEHNSWLLFSFFFFFKPMHELYISVWNLEAGGDLAGMKAGKGQVVSIFS